MKHWVFLVKTLNVSRPIFFFSSELKTLFPQGFMRIPAVLFFCIRDCVKKAPFLKYLNKICKFFKTTQFLGVKNNQQVILEDQQIKSFFYRFSGKIWKNFTRKSVKNAT